MVLAKMRLSNGLKALLSFIVVIFVVACGPMASKEPTTKTINVGLLPDRSPAELRKQYTPLFDYISKEADVPYQLVIPQNYQELVLLFEKGAVDLAFFGGYTFVKANENHGAVPIVMRDIDRSFLSVVITRKDTKLNNLTDLEGQSFTFGSDLSTSGHLMPRYYFSKLNIIPEQYFSEVKFSQAHDKTVEHVYEGKAKAGVLNANVYQRMTQSNPEMEAALKVIWQSPPYPDYVWAAQSDLDKQVVDSLLGAFLSLDYNSAKEAKILDLINAEVFYPATTGDFSELKKAITLMNQAQGASH